MKEFNLQQFAAAQSDAQPFDGGKYGNPTDIENKAVAGKDVILSVWNSDGTTLLAIKGQRGLTINRSSDSIEITSKDTEGGWKAKLAGMKEWGIDTDGIYYANDESHKILSRAFEESNPVLVKITNKKFAKDMYGGLAVITDFPLEAPYDDSMTYSMTLEGMGPLVDLSDEQTVSEPAQE